MNVDRGAGDAEDGGDLVGRPVRVVVEDDREPLRARDRGERADEVVDWIGKLVARFAPERRGRPATSHLASREPERRRPDPTVRRSDLTAAGDQLCERLGE